MLNVYDSDRQGSAMLAGLLLLITIVIIIIISSPLNFLMAGAHLVYLSAPPHGTLHIDICQFTLYIDRCLFINK